MGEWSSHRALRVVVLGAVVACPLSSPALAQVVRQLTHLSTDNFGEFALDDAGTVLVASVGHDPLSLNPQHASQLFGWSLPSATLTQATVLPLGIADSVSVSDDGTTAAFVSPADPLGTNHDASLEVFVIDIPTSTITQLTSDPGPGAGSASRVRLSGNGNRVAFLSNTDPLGTNANHEEHLFAVNTDGTQLTQVTAGLPSATYGEFSISDNGTLIAYKNTEAIALPPFQYEAIFVIGSNGNNRTELANGQVDDPVISGNGALVIYERDGRIESVPRLGGAATVLVAGNMAHSPTVTDDGAWVYYSALDSLANYEIYEVSTSIPTPTQVTFTNPPLINSNPVVSGDRTRVAFTVSRGAAPGGSNPDGEDELVIMGVDGSSVSQLTSNAGSFLDCEPTATLDGSRVVFTSNGDYLNLGPTAVHRVLLLDVNSGAITAITNEHSSNPTISQDGFVVSFLSTQDPLGSNPANAPQVFATNASGGSIQQITSGNGPKFQPVIAHDGSFVVVEAWEDYTGANPDGTAELFKVPISGGPITQLTTDLESGTTNIRISQDDQWIVFHSVTDFDGANPNGYSQVFRARTDGTLEQRITTDATAYAISPTVSADGGRIVFASNIDPFGTNADGNADVFLWDGFGPTLQQLTFTVGQSDFGIRPTITPDGEYVFFFSTNPFFEDRPDHPKELFRLRVSDVTIERASGLFDPRRFLGSSDTGEEHPVIHVDVKGRAVLVGSANLGGENNDLDSQIWSISFDEPNRIIPSKTAPTIVSWDPTPQALRYDVIRGDVANLSASAGSVDLGGVVCVEDDSPDNSTVGFEDPTQPIPGQVFFYLHRGSQGALASVGTWGFGAFGERYPSGGDCQTN